MVSISTGSRATIGGGSSSSKKNGFRFTIYHAVFFLFICSNALSFGAGITWAMTHYSLGGNNSFKDLKHSCDCNTASENIGQKKKSQTQQRLGEEVVEETSYLKEEIFPKSTQAFASGIARISKEDFFTNFDIGTPWDSAKSNSISLRYAAEDILILYGNYGQTFPSNGKDPLSSNAKSSQISLLNTSEALSNCGFMNIILTGGSRRDQCLAIIPEYESYHIMKYVRRPEKGGYNRQENFRLTSRGYNERNGGSVFNTPSENAITKKYELLTKYYNSLADVMNNITPILDKIKEKTGSDTIIVMVCNWGQSILLKNFVCAARARNLQHVLDHVIIFATDEKTRDLAQNVLGLSSYYDHANFEETTEKAASSYGDQAFIAMMMAKVLSVHWVSKLGYDVLFQDVDIVWYKNPLDYFNNTLQISDNERDPNTVVDTEFDIYFQDDGSRSVRYAPFSANSGFYYVRNNKRTKYFLLSLVTAADFIIVSGSHQRALVAVMSEHVSLYGLRVKVLSRSSATEGELFPAGFQYHQATKQYMKKLINNETKPYLFHMSWTKNKDNKVFFFKQMGDWFTIEDEAVQQSVETLCSPTPLISCHYRDKPSIIPCKDSPPIDTGHKSWW